MSDDADLDQWREQLAADAMAGYDTGDRPTVSGERNFMKGMYTDLVVTGELEGGHVLDVLRDDGRFDTLHGLLVDDAPAHFEGFMTDPDWDLTLLAPTDEAFDALPDGVVDALRQDPTTLTHVLDQHILLAYLPAEVVTDGRVRTVIGFVDATIDDGTIRFDDATVIEPDIEASNAIVHAVDTVLIEPSVIEDLTDQ